MKLIVSGATGFVATEVVRQGLRRPDVTTLVVLSRKPIAAPDVDAAHATKLKQVLIKDYAEYPDDVKKELAGANACIWTVAVTPTKSKAYNFDDVRRICYTSTVAGINAMYDAAPAKPFRFLYMSGHGIERDMATPPRFFGPYLMMRGEVESKVLEFAKEHPGEVEVAIARPGLITSSVNAFRAVWGTALRVSGMAVNIPLEELATAMLDQAINGFEKDTITNADLARIAKKVNQGESAQ